MITRRLVIAVSVMVAAMQPPAAWGQRAREIGVPFEGVPGKLNAITDVAGVEVGQTTIVSGEGALVVGKGPVRTGVTVVFPRGRASPAPVYGGFFNINGNGEMTGISYLQDFGVVQGPIGITNTNAIGQVYAGIQQWTSARFGSATFPVVAETWDGALNDLEGFHVTPETTRAALDAARPGVVEEGNVGGGTGMTCFGFKGGIGTSSRTVKIGQRDHHVGVLVQCNTGARKALRIAGAPVGAAFGTRWLPCYDRARAPADKRPRCAGATGSEQFPADEGSIIIVVATDAPMLPVQLNRMAKRAGMGLARLGSYAGNGSGDLVVAFSTVPDEVNHPDQSSPSPLVPVASKAIDPLFEAAVQATEEAIVNAMVAARTMVGTNGYTVTGLPHGELRDILKRYGRLDTTKYGKSQ